MQKRFAFFIAGDVSHTQQLFGHTFYARQFLFDMNLERQFNHLDCRFTLF
ncbi:MAG: hypothetical protein R3C26_03155 [Calditrichia bacterium]